MIVVPFLSADSQVFEHFVLEYVRTNAPDAIVNIDSQVIVQKVRLHQNDSWWIRVLMENVLREQSL